MSTFDPVTLFSILHETMGVWLWVMFGTAFVLLVGIVSAFVKLRRARCPVSRPIWMAVAAGLIAAAGLTFVVPIWSLADPSALSGSVDYAVAFLIALAPGALVAALAFVLVARRLYLPPQNAGRGILKVGV
jgi:hypothetical protein